MFRNVCFPIFSVFQMQYILSMKTLPQEAFYSFLKRKYCIDDVYSVSPNFSIRKSGGRDPLGTNRNFGGLYISTRDTQAEATKNVKVKSSPLVRKQHLQVLCISSLFPSSHVLPPPPHCCCIFLSCYQYAPCQKLKMLHQKSVQIENFWRTVHESNPTQLDLLIMFLMSPRIWRTGIMPTSLPRIMHCLLEFLWFRRLHIIWISHFYSIYILHHFNKTEISGLFPRCPRSGL